MFEENSDMKITWLPWHHRFRKAPYSKCFPSTRKRKAGVFIFHRLDERFGKAPLSWRISVDGRPHGRNKASVFKFLRFEKRFRKTPFSWLISVKGRSNCKKNSCVFKFLRRRGLKQNYALKRKIFEFFVLLLTVILRCPGSWSVYMANRVFVVVLVAL